MNKLCPKTIVLALGLIIAAVSLQSCGKKPQPPSPSPQSDTTTVDSTKQDTVITRAIQPSDSESRTFKKDEVMPQEKKKQKEKKPEGNINI